MSYPNAVEHLSLAIQLTASIGKWSSFIKDHYPKLNARMKGTKVGRHACIYTWAADGTAMPLALLSHVNTAPLDPAGAELWEHDPYAGYTDQTYIYGAGAVSPLGRTIAVLEAFEKLCRENEKPTRTIYLCLDDDASGSADIVDWFKSHSILLESVSGPGSFIEDGTLWDLSKPVAMVGLAQCSQARLEMTFTADKYMNAVTAAAQFITNLAKRPLSIQKSGAMDAQCEILGAYTSGHMQALLAGKQYRALINRFRSVSSEYHNSLRGRLTADSIVMTADGNVNVSYDVSLTPGQTVDDIINHLQRVAVLCEIPTGLKLKVIQRPAMTTETSIKTITYQLISDVYHGLNPALIVAPQVINNPDNIGDYQPIAAELYRFDPFWLSGKERESLTAGNERLLITSFNFGIDFFYEYLAMQSRRIDISEALNK